MSKIILTIFLSVVDLWFNNVNSCQIKLLFKENSNQNPNKVFSQEVSTDSITRGRVSMQDESISLGRS